MSKKYTIEELREKNKEYGNSETVSDFLLWLYYVEKQEEGKKEECKCDKYKGPLSTVEGDWLGKEVEKIEELTVRPKKGEEFLGEYRDYRLLNAEAKIQEIIRFINKE